VGSITSFQGSSSKLGKLGSGSGGGVSTSSRPGVVGSARGIRDGKKKERERCEEENTASKHASAAGGERGKEMSPRML